jgi:hypothetical protein
MWVYFVLLVVLVMEAAGMRRSLRIERERRLVVHEPFKNFADLTADSPWQNAKDGAWILVSPAVHAQSAAGPSIIDFSPKRVAKARSPSGTLRLTSSGCGKPKGGQFQRMRLACQATARHTLASVTWHLKYYVNGNFQLRQR